MLPRRRTTADFQPTVQQTPSGGWSILEDDGDDGWLPAAPATHLPAQAPGNDLFRSEALAARLGPRDGEVLLRPIAGSAWWTGAAIAMALAVIALLFMGTYTRRATVPGVLSPAQGVVRIMAPQPAFVVEQHARQGQKVAAGDVLFVLSADRPTVGGGEYQQAISDSLKRREAQLGEAQARMRAAAAQEEASLRQRAGTLQAERPHVAAQLAEQKKRVALAREQSKTWAGLFEQRIVTREQFLQRETELLDQTSRLRSLERDAIALDRELANVQSSLNSSRARLDDQLEAARREGEQLRQQLTESEARRRIVITAPRDGVLSLVNANAGGSVDPLKPMAQLLPAGEALRAELFAPSRAIGHVKAGNDIWLRYEAFPYERYGMQKAKVISVAETPLGADEIPSWTGMATSPEPLFRIVAQLDGADFGPSDLRPGMRFEADLMFEKRRLIEWLLLPALQITERN